MDRTGGRFPPVMLLGLVVALGALAGCQPASAGADDVVAAHAHSAAGPVARLRQLGLTVTERAGSADGHCAADSYGQIQVFFRAHACTALHRVLLDVRDRSGRDALVAIAWVDLPTPATATQLHTLIDRGSTGNLTELTRTVRFTGRYYASAQGGNTVVDAQAEPVGAGPDDLAGLATTAIG